MYYTHSFSNAILKSPADFYCQMGYQAAGLSPVVNHSIQLSRHQQFTHVGQVLQDLIQKLGFLSSCPPWRAEPTIMDICLCRRISARAKGEIIPIGLNWITFAAIW